MNRTEALTRMLQGETVEAIDPLYLRHVEHGGKHLFRWNDVTHCIEWNSGREWRRCRNAFYLSEQFKTMNL